MLGRFRPLFMVAYTVLDILAVVLARIWISKFGPQHYPDEPVIFVSHYGVHYDTQSPELLCQSRPHV